MTDWYYDWSNRHLPKPGTPGENARKRHEYFKKYRERNREKLREYHKLYYRKNRQKWDKPRPLHDYKNCIVCGDPFYPVHFSDKYCCARCRRKASSNGNL